MSILDSTLPSLAASAPYEKMSSQETPQYILHSRPPHYSFWPKTKKLHPRTKDFFEANRSSETLALIQNAIQDQEYRSIAWVNSPHASPNKAALKSIAQRYWDKYKIYICIKSITSLSASISSFESEIKNAQEMQHRFIGFIVGQKEHIQCGHLAPLLGFFQKAHPPQFLLMDVVGESPLHLKHFIPSALTQDICDQSSFVIASGNRQADPFSCRLGAIVLLRNAMLWLQNAPTPSAYWKRACAAAPQTIPFEWSYIEQIQQMNKENRPLAVCKRDQFSKNPTKREHPRLTENRFNAYFAEVTMSQYIYCRFSEKLEKKSLRILDLPAQTTLEFVSDGIILDFSYKIRVNSYLLEKGYREIAKLSNKERIQLKKVPTHIKSEPEFPPKKRPKLEIIS
jgi:hypothetical protein